MDSAQLVSRTQPYWLYFRATRPSTDPASLVPPMSQRLAAQPDGTERQHRAAAYSVFANHPSRAILP